MTLALSIAGSDPTGAAGLELDLRVFQAFGLHGCGVATALTVQDSKKVHSVQQLSPESVFLRLDTLMADMTPAVMKVGMLANRELVEGLVERLEINPQPIPVVLDPVLVSSSGHPLLEESAIEVIRDDLLPLVNILTPNRAEAIRLLRSPQSHDPEDLVSELGDFCDVVVMTGGDSREPKVVDYVYCNGAVDRIESPRIPGLSPHGTGCTFSSAIASGLALGQSVTDAISNARDFTIRAIRSAKMFGHKTGKPFCRF